MKNNLFKSLPFVLVFIVSVTMFAQVGIGTTDPHISSVLDIQSADSGVLIPRVGLTSTTTKLPIPNPIESLLVYNTNTAGDVIPGFYYWTGAAWKPLVSSGGGGGTAGWGLSGNAVVATHFLGTTNYQPLKFSVNNLSFGLFHPGGGLALGRGAAANNNHAIALGTDATASKNKDVAIGEKTSATGQYSVALGTEATSSGQYSTALGMGATSSAQYSTAIGTGAFANQANAIVLGNITNANVGIGTSTPNTNAKLDVNGQFKLGSKGGLHKNIMSFEVGMGLGNIPANGSSIIEIAIPTTSQPTGAKASVVVTPQNGMNDSLHIAWVKLSGTDKIRVKLLNTTGSIIYNPYVTFYSTIHEF